MTLFLLTAAFLGCVAAIAYMVAKAPPTNTRREAVIILGILACGILVLIFLVGILPPWQRP